MNCLYFFPRLRTYALDPILLVLLGDPFPTVFTHLILHYYYLPLYLIIPTNIQTCSICHLAENGPRIHIPINFFFFVIKLPQRVSILIASPRITPNVFSFLPAASIMSIETINFQPLPHLISEQHLKQLITKLLSLSLSLFFFGCICDMWKFPGQGLNRCHSSDNTGSLTH